ncbi:uncharacterized protein AB9W97_014769 isoform 3-T3 [Spinachia spinachia]
MMMNPLYHHTNNRCWSACPEALFVGQQVSLSHPPEFLLRSLNHQMQNARLSGSHQPMSSSPWNVSKIPEGVNRTRGGQICQEIAKLKTKMMEEERL